MEEENELNDRKMKQKYLREHIIQEKLNPEEFSIYLSQRKEDGQIIRSQHRLLDF